MVIPPFRLEDPGTQGIFNVCQITKILIVGSTWNSGEFVVILLNAGKKPKMVSQKLSKVGVHLLEDCRRPWNTKSGTQEQVEKGKLKEEFFVLKWINVGSAKEQVEKGQFRRQSALKAHVIMKLLVLWSLNLNRVEQIKFDLKHLETNSCLNLSCRL